MTPGGVLLLLFLLGSGALVVATLAITVRGGRGPADPPASHARVDPAGFPVLSAPRGVRHRVGPRSPGAPAGRPSPVARPIASTLVTPR